MTDLDAIVSVATADVRSAIRWLVNEGAEVTRTMPRERMDSALVELSLTDAEVQIVRDRSMWMMSLRANSASEWLDFDLVLRAQRGDDAFSEENIAVGQRVGRRNSRRVLPRQAPRGVSWRDDLPGALRWLIETPGAPQRVLELRASRGQWRIEGHRPQENDPNQ